MGLGKPRDARLGVDGLAVLAVPAGIGAVEGVINIAVAGVHHDVHVERLLQEVVGRQLEINQVVQRVEYPVVVLVGKALRVRAVSGGQLGADLLFQLVLKRPLIVLIPLVQLLPEGRHGVLGARYLDGRLVVHLVPVVGVDLAGKRAVLLALNAQKCVQDVGDGLFQLVQ